MHCRLPAQHPFSHLPFPSVHLFSLEPKCFRVNPFPSYQNVPRSDLLLGTHTRQFKRTFPRVVWEKISLFSEESHKKTHLSPAKGELGSLYQQPSHQLKGTSHRQDEASTANCKRWNEPWSLMPMLNFWISQW